MKYILLEKNQNLTTLTLKRPEKRNALNLEMLQEISSSLDQIHEDSSLRVLLIRGSGKIFCAGMDLHEAKDPTLSKKVVEEISTVVKKILSLPLITLSEIHGACMAGGMALAMACDITIASEETSFSFPEVRRGLVPAIVTALLHRQINERDLRELLLLGEPFDSWHAHRIGLLNRLVPPNLLQEETKKIIQSSLKGSPSAIEETKKLLRILPPNTIEQEINQALQSHKKMLSHKDAQEGIASFLEKRDPYWVTK